MELNDIYDENRNLTGKLHRRGTPWKPGEYGLVVCVWVYDGRGHLLLTRRAREKSFAGTWENSGGAVKAGETSRQAIARELYEETGIQAQPEEFELLDSDRERNIFYDHYCLFRNIPLKSIVLQPGETDSVMWASFGKVDWMIRTGKICKVIGLSHAVTVHGLRHTYVTHYYLHHKNDPDFDLATFSKSIGHSSIRTTMEIYAHLDMTQNRYIPRAMEDLKEF